MPHEANWSVWDFSVSPDGARLAVGLRSRLDVPGFMLLVFDVGLNSAQEIPPSPKARDQLLAENSPGLMVADWANAGALLRFPAGRVEPGTLRPNYQTGEPRAHPGVVVGSRAWFSANLLSESHPSLELDDSDATLARAWKVPSKIDSRLGLHTNSKYNFDILDLERGGRILARLSGGMARLSLASATVSEDGKWIGAVVAREAGFSSPKRGFLIERDTGRVIELGDGVVSLLRFDPTRRLVYGVSEGVSDSAELVRWRY